MQCRAVPARELARPRAGFHFRPEGGPSPRMQSSPKTLDRRMSRRRGFGEERVQIEWPREHGQLTPGGPRPFFPGAIAIKLDSIFVGITQIKRFAYAVVAGAIEWNIRRHQSLQGIRQRRPRRVKNGKMKETGATGRWGRPGETFPGVEADVMMISASRDKGGASTPALRQLEPENAAIEFQRSFQVGDLEMDVTDSNLRINR